MFGRTVRHAVERIPPFDRGRLPGCLLLSRVNNLCHLLPRIHRVPKWPTCMSAISSTPTDPPNKTLVPRVLLDLVDRQPWCRGIDDASPRFCSGPGAKASLAVYLQAWEPWKMENLDRQLAQVLSSIRSGILAACAFQQGWDKMKQLVDDNAEPVFSSTLLQETFEASQEIMDQMSRALPCSTTSKSAGAPLGQPERF